MMRTFTPVKTLVSCLLLVTLLSTSFGCKKAKEVIEEAWAGYWKGVFDLGDGWQVELDGDRATFVTAGTSKLGIKAGDPFTVGMAKTGDNTWRGYVRSQNGFGFLGWGNAKIQDNKLTITPDEGSPYTVNAGTKSTGGSTGGTGGIGAGAQVLADEKVSGKRGEKKIFRITVPSGVKQMEIKTSERTDSYYYNLADLFVRKGSEPVISLTPQYSWTADCAGVESNRSDEVCSFTNPAAGEWVIVLYGYNSEFTTQLTVKITK
ncbi:hypothetical protein GZH53_04715 [Flavihumibacter sp. R14]|nr:hypothetical protein [Flavihumibacter soli]